MARREKRKAKTKAIAKVFESGRPVPNYGMSEEEAFQLRKTVLDLVPSHNNVVKTIDSMQQMNVPEKAIEAHYMLTTIIELLVRKGIFNGEDVKAVAERIQLADLGWVPKPEPAVVEIGDILRFKFEIFDGDKLIDDQTADPFAYTMGSNGLSCEKEFMGMKVGEQRTCKVVFGVEYKHKEYAGKELTMVALCTGIMQPMLAQGKKTEQVSAPNVNKSGWWKRIWS